MVSYNAVKYFSVKMIVWPSQVDMIYLANWASVFTYIQYNPKKQIIYNIWPLVERKRLKPKTFHLICISDQNRHYTLDFNDSTPQSHGLPCLIPFKVYLQKRRPTSDTNKQHQSLQLQKEIHNAVSNLGMFGRLAMHSDSDIKIQLGQHLHACMGECSVPTTHKSNKTNISNML